MNDQNKPSSKSGHANSEKKIYRNPKLKRFGAIESLTTGGSSGNTEMKAHQTNKRA